MVSRARVEVRSSRIGNKPKNITTDTTCRVTIRYVRTDDENDDDDIVHDDAGVRARSTMRADDARGAPARSFGEGNDANDD